MSFRRPAHTAREKQQWRSFIATQDDKLRQLGMPAQVYCEKSTFDHWLMHGVHPLDPSRFSVEDLDQPKRDALVRLIAAYINAGFRDPGIAILSIDEKRRIRS